MKDDLLANAPPDPLNAPATAHGLSFSTAFILTVLCAVITVAGSYGVVRGLFSTSIRGAISIITLVALVGLGYGAFQLILALVATTGERRWFSRSVSERRTGDRARKTGGD